ncbi:hypothetical protein BHUM_01388c [Candidatus Burkholderia humilis]|nr:hypothetical protein BHUM_01388c [Candidatus Burkholderia humilis]
MSNDDVSGILSRLVSVRNVEGYWLQSTLAALSTERCSLVLDFFLARLKHSTKIDEWSYEICFDRPYDAVEFNMKGAVDAEACMMRLLAWMREHTENEIVSEAGELFSKIFGPLDESVLATLSTQLNPLQPDSIRIMSAIFAHADSDFVFNQRPLVVQSLEAAQTYSRELADELVSSLYRSATTGPRGRIRSASSSAEFKLAARAEEVLSETSRFSPAYRLYDGIRKYAVQSLEMTRTLDESLNSDDE